jgi:hypothetical protein
MGILFWRNLVFRHSQLLALDGPKCGVGDFASAFPRLIQMIPCE